MHIRRDKVFETIMQVVIVAILLSVVATVFFLILVRGGQEKDDELHAGVNEEYDRLLKEIESMEAARERMEKELNE